MHSTLREYFPAALAAYAELTLTGPDTLELLAKAPDPAAAARLTIPQISAALKRARRRGVAGKAERIQAALSERHLGQSEIVTEAYAASVTAAAAVIAVERADQDDGSPGGVAFSPPPLMPGPTSASPASGSSPAPGCSASSATRPAGTPTPKRAAPTPAPRR